MRIAADSSTSHPEQIRWEHAGCSVPALGSESEWERKVRESGVDARLSGKMGRLDLDSILHVRDENSVKDQAYV